MNLLNTKNPTGDDPNICIQKKRGRGRPRVVEGRQFTITFRVRDGRSEAEDKLIDRLARLADDRQRSRYIRRVLTTGDIDPILDREFARESAWAASALDSLGSAWDDEED